MGKNLLIRLSWVAKKVLSVEGRENHKKHDFLEFWKEHHQLPHINEKRGRFSTIVPSFMLIGWEEVARKRQRVIDIWGTKNMNELGAKFELHFTTRCETPICIGANLPSTTIPGVRPFTNRKSSHTCEMKQWKTFCKGHASSCKIFSPCWFQDWKPFLSWSSYFSDDEMLKFEQFRAI